MREVRGLDNFSYLGWLKALKLLNKASIFKYVEGSANNKIIGCFLALFGIGQK